MLRSVSVILQHSVLYNRVGSVQLWYSLSLVLVLNWDDFHTLFSIQGIPGLVKEILDVTACSANMTDSATEVGEFFSC